VELALQILDGYVVRGHAVKVEPAQFAQKGAFDPAKKRKKLPSKVRQKRKEKQERSRKKIFRKFFRKILENLKIKKKFSAFSIGVRKN
jgi:hypothetical protein